eukprot:3745509-Amphidinium_carterae.1
MSCKCDPLKTTGCSKASADPRAAIERHMEQGRTKQFSTRVQKKMHTGPVAEYLAANNSDSMGFLFQHFANFKCLAFGAISLVPL